jgi:hypothetical protein
MITLKEWMEVVDYRITEGSGYSWQCFGANAYCLDSWDGDQDGHSLSIHLIKKHRQCTKFKFMTTVINVHIA